MPLRQNEGLISVPTGRFVAAALLSLQKAFVIGHEGVIPGCDAFSLRSSNPQGVAQS